MTATVTYDANLRTTCLHLQSGSNFETDAPSDNKGQGARFSPTDLIATGLGAYHHGYQSRKHGYQIRWR